MGRRLNIVFLATIAIATILQSSSAQTAYVVGDASGWVVPPGGPMVYTTWAASKAFRVGDTLVFNFASGVHNVARVTRANFDACNSTNPLLLLSNGPANFTLNETGNHYFLCAFPGHCSAGQRLAINVSAAASSPAPQPSTPPPQPTTSPPASTPQPSGPVPAPQASSPSPISAPTPAPSRPPMTYIVGDNLGWTVPSDGASAYERWANGKTFMVGDILVFNYATGAHDVAEVTREAYQQCNTSNTLSNFTTGPTRITLGTLGEHFYICAITGHCNAGQKLAINVTDGSPTATPPSSSSPSPSPSPSTPTPPSSSSPSPSPSTATPPSSTTSPPPPAGDEGAPPPPPGNSATSLGVAGLSVTFLSFIIALFMC
ncbi:blue copper protein-like [Herrania umbratica]|uniref:Blue copper protein-like n=1 Tax=Herrania umbratica TaxID=108875 RepID=A0A6J0ZPI1_9ROSI|nr:blue copper protein-like [Herrania umbratica]